MVFLVLSPPQAGTPQSSGSQRASSDQDSDCVPIQVFLQPSQLKYGKKIQSTCCPKDLCEINFLYGPGGS